MTSPCPPPVWHLVEPAHGRSWWVTRCPDCQVVYTVDHLRLPAPQVPLEVPRPHPAPGVRTAGSAPDVEDV